MNFKNKSRGFTLIEMLIVITIIALLASLILVGMGGARAKTRDSRRIADLHNVMNALELYYAKNSYYPQNINTWGDLDTELTGAGIGVSRIPYDPLRSTEKTYEYGVEPVDYQDYVLGALLEQDDAVLQDDIDGVPYGLSCDDAPDYNYCIRP